MRVLGFDPSMTNFGWAVHDTEFPSGSPNRCVARGRFQTSSKTLFIDRYVDLRESVRTLVEKMGVEHGVTRIGVESPVFGESYSEGLYGLYLYNCEALRAAKMDVVFFSPGQIKAHAHEFMIAGNYRPAVWKMDKPDMVEAAKLDCGYKGNWNHNEADAYWAARIAGRFWKLHDWVLKPEDLTGTEAKQFTKIHTYQRGAKAGDTERKGILYREDERFFLWSKQES